VVKLEPMTLRTTLSPGTHERAPAAVALPNGAPDRGGDVARARRRIGIIDALSRLRRFAVALRFDPFQLVGHRRVDDDFEIGPPRHERLEARELVAKLPARGELHFVGRFRQRLDHGRALRRRGRLRYHRRRCRSQ